MLFDEVRRSDLVSTTESPTAPGWKAGAKALAAFKPNTTVSPKAAWSCGPRKGSKYATLTDILAVCAKGAARDFHTPDRLDWLGKAFWCGGKCCTTNPVKASTPSTPSPSGQGPSSQRQQDLGGCITYARKYCLQGLYGLLPTMGLILMRSATAMPEHLRLLHRTSPTPAPAPLPVAVEKPEQRALRRGEKAGPVDHQRQGQRR